MTGGRNLLLLGGALAVASCTADRQVKVRAIPNPGATSKSGDALLAQARGEIALGNVGLALENLRTLQREQPENPEVFEAIAQCYGAMSRFDLVRTNLEFALAYAPNDPRLLNELASSLDQLGEREQAAEVRAEAMRLTASQAAHPLTQQAAVTPMGVPRTGSVTVELPAPRPIKRTAATKPLIPQQPESPMPPPRVIPFPRVAAGKSEVNVAAAPGSIAREQSLAEVRLPPVTAVAEPPAPASTRTSIVPFEVTSRPRFTPSGTGVDVAVAPRSLTGQQSLAEMRLAPVVQLAEAAPALAQSSTAAVDVSALHRRAPSNSRVHVAVAPAALSASRVLSDMSAETNLAQPEVPLSAAKSAAIQAQQPVRRDQSAATIQSEEIASADPVLKVGPYLERTSRGEVALITTVPHIRMTQFDRELLRAPTIASSAPAKRPASPQPKPQQMALLATRVQWVPLKYASMPQSVELLNAARSQGLAARTRIVLQDRGWRKIRIGNARNVRQRSLVLYSAARVQIAHRLAAHFRCPTLRIAGLKNVIVLLGRDAAARRGQSARA